MRIENLRSEQVNDRSRVCATIHWEDQEKPAFDMYFETDSAYARDLTCNPHAFLIAAIMPAFCHDEKRIRIDAPIDPELLDGMTTAMGWVRHWWFEPSKKLLKIEAPLDRPPKHTNPDDTGTDKRIGMFFSGGIDSLAAIRANRLAYPKGHPRFINDGLIVMGLETDKEENFQHVLATIAGPAKDVGLNLIPVYTNARHLDADWMFWERKSHDAILSSIAYALSNRFSEVAIASTYDIPAVQPTGTHPLLDLAYSSHQLRIRHDNIALPRIDKVKLVGAWDIAYHSLRVCNKSELYENGKLNCCRCIKCVRTMLEFEALGMLKGCRAFSSHQLSTEMISPVVNLYKTTVDFYAALVHPLRDQSRPDLADHIESKIDIYERRKEKDDLVSALKAIAKRFDRKFFNGALWKSRKTSRQSNEHKPA